MVTLLEHYNAFIENYITLGKITHAVLENDNATLENPGEDLVPQDIVYGIKGSISVENYEEMSNY